MNVEDLLQNEIYTNMRTPLFLRMLKLADTLQWANERLLPWDDNYLTQAQAFMQRHYWTAQGSVNVFQVVGTAHQQYQQRTWFDLLTSGKRMDINLPLQDKNPEYYRATTPKVPMMYFNTFDGMNFYIGQDGNHRTCIAKFMFYETGETQLHGVTINHYDIHHEFYQLYKSLLLKIKQLNLAVELIPLSERIKRDDTAGWMIDYFSTTLSWLEYDEQTYKEQETRLNYEQSAQKLSDLTKQFEVKQQNTTVPKSFWKRLFYFS